MQATEEYCPTCGSPLDGEACDACAVDRPGEEERRGGGALVPCRSCGTLQGNRNRVCDVCGVDHPVSYGGIAPAAQLVLGLFLLAVVLTVLSLIFGPLVG